MEEQLDAARKEIALLNVKLENSAVCVMESCGGGVGVLLLCMLRHLCSTSPAGWWLGP